MSQDVLNIRATCRLIEILTRYDDLWLCQNIGELAEVMELAKEITEKLYRRRNGLVRFNTNYRKDF